MSVRSVLSTPARKTLLAGLVAIVATLLAGGAVVSYAFGLAGVATQTALTVVGGAFAGVVAVQLLAFGAVWRTAVKPAAGASEEFEAYQAELRNFVQESCAALGHCEQGDLTARMATESDIPELNKLGEDFNTMMRRMEAIVSAAKEFSDDVANASAATSDGVARAEEATEQVSELTAEISDEIERDLDASVEEMEALRANAEEISEVAELVGEIARQTNMLGVNARIEATRSAEDNTGFKTVAEQVKELADETQGAAEDIQALLERLQEQVQTTLTDIEATEETVDDGTAVIRTGLAALTANGDGPGADELAGMADGVAPADGRLQYGTVEDASITQVRDTAEELRTKASTLRDALDVFTIGDEVDYSVLEFDPDAEGLTDDSDAVGDSETTSPSATA